jgi:hypothetical protein
MITIGAAIGVAGCRSAAGKIAAGEGKMIGAIADPIGALTGSVGDTGRAIASPEGKRSVSATGSGAAELVEVVVKG